MRHAHGRIFRKRAGCIAIILSLLVVSGTYVFAEEFSGVGLVLESYKIVVVHPETGQATLKPPKYEYFVSPLPDSPAKRADMPELAKLIAVDGYDVDAMDPDMVGARMRGPVGSTVILRVIVEEDRDGVFGRRIQEYALVRERIMAPHQGGQSE